MYRIIQNRKIWLSISGVCLAIALIAICLWGVKPGIDFTGGSSLEVQFAGQAPSTDQVKAALASLNLQSFTPQPTGNNGMILRFQNTDETTHQAVITALNKLVAPATTTAAKAKNTSDLSIIPVGGQNSSTVTVQTQAVGSSTPAAVTELQFSAVGPSIGSELTKNAVDSIILVLILIIIYIAYAFRKVSKPLPSWKYGLAGILALAHDVPMVVGVFAVLGHFYGVEVNTPFIAALLTVLGFSIHDTIVVFDRVRENLPKSRENFEETVNMSVNQTLVRSINTSVTVLLVLLSILVFGGESIRYFALALFMGIFFGTYSSIFLASPLLVIFEKWQHKKTHNS